MRGEGCLSSSPRVPRLIFPANNKAELNMLLPCISLVKLRRIANELGKRS